MPKSPARQNHEVLSDPREKEAQGDGAVRLFAGKGNNDLLGAGSSVEGPISQPDGGDGNVRSELLRLMRLPVAELEKQVDTRRITAGQQLARVLLKKAILDEQNVSIQEVLDRIEGKPTKSAPNKASNESLLDQLDESLDSLNKLTEPQSSD